MTSVETAIVAMVILAVFCVAVAEWTFRFLQRRGNQVLPAGRRRRFSCDDGSGFCRRGLLWVAFSAGHAGMASASSF